MAITNDSTYGLLITFRFYMNGDGRVNWEKERTGLTTQEEIEGKNRLNIELFNHLGENRDQIFFSDTTLFCTVKALNSCDRKPTSTLKFFSI